MSNKAIMARLGSLGAGAVNVCAATTLAAIMILMVVDVTARYLFNHPVPGAAEIIELAMAILVFSALPMTTLRREHITLDYIEKAVPAGLTRALQVFVDIITALIIGFLAWRLSHKAVTIHGYGDTTPYLQWPITPVAVFVAAMAAITAVLLVISAFQPRRQYENFEEGAR